MLKDLVKNKRVALVGPSPHILGKKQGSYIVKRRYKSKD